MQQDCRRDQAIKALWLCLPLIVSGIGMARAIESPDYWWLGWIALLPLFLSIRVLTPGRALLAGAVWGVSLFVFSSLAAETFISPTLSSLVLLAVVPATYAYVGARMTEQVGFSPFLLALGWVGVEFGLGPLGLRHGVLAGTQGDGIVLRVFGSFTGYVLVAFLVAYVNACLLSVLVHVPVRQGRGPRVRGVAPSSRRWIPTDAWLAPTYLLRPSSPRAPPVPA